MNTNGNEHLTPRKPSNIPEDPDKLELTDIKAKAKRQLFQSIENETLETKRIKYENDVNEIQQKTSSLKLKFTPKKSSVPQVLFAQVRGYQNRRNDVLYMPPLNNSSSRPSCWGGKEPSLGKFLIFFGSDYQDFRLKMKLSPKGKRFLTYNLESVAAELQKSFPNYHIFVIRPNQILNGIFSCYENFVQTSTCGIPVYCGNNEAITHLWKLINSLGVKLFGEKDQSQGVSECEEKENEVIFKECDMKLVGLGKGAAVLNQLLYEFHYIRTLSPGNLKFEPFLESVKDMYFLNPTHTGRRGIFVNHSSILDTASRLGIRFHLHLSTYTPVAHEKTDVIKSEEVIFSTKLKNFGGDIKRYVHFTKSPPASLLHFQIIKKLRGEAIDTLEHSAPSVAGVEVGRNL